MCGAQSLVRCLVKMEFLILLIAFAIIQDVSSFPAKGHPYKSEHCIKMTPQKELEINQIITRITDFLGNFTTEFEDFDIRLIKIDIESHFEDEIETKDLQLQLTVNDCTDYMGDDKDNARKSEETDNSGDEQEKDSSIEVHDESNKNKPDEKQNIETTSPDTAIQTSESSTQANDVKGCEKCPCVCNSGNQNGTPVIKEQSNENNLDTDKNEPNSKTEADTSKNNANAGKTEADANKNNANAGKTEADTNKNNTNAGKTNTDTSANEKDTEKVNQGKTNTGYHYDVTPVETIRFYDFGEETNSNRNKGCNKQPEITKIFSFSREE